MSVNPHEEMIRVQKKKIKTSSGEIEMRRFPNAKTAMYVTVFADDFRPPEPYAIQRLKQLFENHGFAVETATSPALPEAEVEDLRKKWNKKHKKDGREFVPPARVSTLKVSSGTIDVGRDFIRLALNAEHPYGVFTHWNGSEVTVGVAIYRKDLVTHGEYDVIPFDVGDKYVLTTESSSKFTKLSKRLYLKQWQDNLTELAKIREIGTSILQKSMGLEDDEEEEITL